MGDRDEAVLDAWKRGFDSGTRVGQAQMVAALAAMIEQQTGWRVTWTVPKDERAADKIRDIKRQIYRS